MSALIDEKLDTSDVDEPTDEREPAPLPPPPRINGVPADTWAIGIERKIDAIFDANTQALEALANTVATSNKEVADGFARILETMKSIERHEQMLREDRLDINALDSKVNQLRDRVDKLERVAPLPKATALRRKTARKKK